jgi:hypothetical protein
MILLGLLAGVLGADPAPKVPVALVAGLPPPFTLERAGAKLTVGEGGLLLPGDRVSAGPKGGITVVLLSDGRRVRLKPDRAATITEKGFDPADAGEVVDGPRPDPAMLEGLREAYRARIAVGAAVTVLRGPPEAAKARGVTPMFGTWVLTARPPLEWPAVVGAERYRVEVFAGDDEVRPLWRADTAATRLPYPPLEQPLLQGGKYRWRVTAELKGGQEQPVVSSKFFTASERVADLLAKVPALARGDDPVGWLLAVEVYDLAGVYELALPLYEKLAARSPDAIGYQLALAAYYTRAGREADAKRAAERAQELVEKAGGN